MRRLMGLVLAVLLLAACAGGAGDAAGPGPADAGTADVPAASGDAIFAFSAPQLGGGQIDGASLEGRDVVLWFWAPW